ncbi:MAG: FtsQ-type POTRA domain-containing protein [Chloroflexi bacterium]|nr:FtsQ-type POTRA domain-containing protein [Chloroflexota bacterium]
MTASRSGRGARRNRTDREALVLRRDEAPESSAELDHGVRINAINWRFVSGLMVATLGLVAVMMLRADIFIVRGIAVNGTSYLDTREIFRYTGIADQHVLTVDPAAVQRALLEIPTIAEADISLGWPPDMVRIRIVEREPALLWNQNGVEAWVDIHGRVLTAPPEDRPGLLRVVTRGVEDPISINDRIPQDVVDGARQLQELVPNERRLRYDPFLGLGFRDDRGWEAWFGSGLDMPVKILVYQRMVEDLLARGVTPSVVNVANPDRPYCSGC